MRISDIPKNWRHTRDGIWHQPRHELKWSNKKHTKKKIYLIWAIYYEKKCLRCNTSCVLPNKKMLYCTSACANIAIRKFGKDHPRWNNGIAECSSGYRLKRIGYKKYIGEHQFKMEKHIGRKLRNNEVVHHKNGKKGDNRLCNLVLMTRAQHASHHHSKHKLPLEVPIFSD